MPRRPVNSPYTITTEFGVPDSYAKFGRHSGVDYAVPKGRPIYAPVSGQLTNIVSPTGGNMVQIFDGRYYHRLMHNTSFSRGNGRVNEGDQVATAGTTGLSTGVHVHWDIADRATPTAFNQFINPATYLATPQQSNNQGDTSMKIGSEPNWRWRMNLLHRQLVGNWDMSDEVFRSIIGQDAWSVVESWSSHSNAPLAQKYQEVGQVAVNDKWDQQIYNLQAQVAELGKRPTQAQLDALVKQADELKKSADSAQASAQEAEVKAREAIEKADKLQDQANKDAEAGNRFLRVLGDLVSKFLPNK